MPYQTASASQYTMIKRLQAGLSGKVGNTKPANKQGNADPLSYDGYAGYSIPVLPPNALISNKFITSSGGGGGGDLVVDMSTGILNGNIVNVRPNILVPAGDFTIKLQNTQRETYPIYYVYIIIDIPSNDIPNSFSVALSGLPDWEPMYGGVDGNPDLTLITITNQPRDEVLTIDENNIIFTGAPISSTITSVSLEYFVDK
jgi:hypothetical protein